LVVPDITNPFFPEVARGIQDIAQQYDHHVFFCNTDDSSSYELKTLRSLASQGVDGIILFSFLTPDDELKLFADLYPPLVLVNRYIDHEHIGLVMVDNTKGATQAVDHFVAQGHHHLGMLSNAGISQDKIRRVQGFKSSLKRHNLPHPEGHIQLTTATLDGGYEATIRLLHKHPQITGIFCYNDLMALGAIRACLDIGRKVPADCAIIGFDDIRIASMITPSLTTIRVAKYELGRQAGNHLMNMIARPKERFPPIEIETQLIVRESV
jgi:DNA-binding LacI/PurR family transcriptional regulator